MMASAAFHRYAEPHQISRRFLQLSIRSLTLGMSTLMLSLGLDCYLTARIILKQRLLSGLIAGALVEFFPSLWFVLPRLA